MRVLLGIMLSFSVFAGSAFAKDNEKPAFASMFVGAATGTVVSLVDMASAGTNMWPLSWIVENIVRDLVVDTIAEGKRSKEPYSQLASAGSWLGYYWSHAQFSHQLHPGAERLQPVLYLGMAALAMCGAIAGI